MADVRWRHQGNRLLLPIAVFPSEVADNHLQNLVVEALIDTGATGTAIRPDVARELSISGRGKRLVATANGEMLVPEFRIRLGFFAGDFSGPAEAPAYPIVLDLGVQAHALQPNFRYQMLLGMDVLRHCDLIMLRDGSVRLTLP